MKKKSKRYYGMTVTQLGILGGAALFGMLIIGVIFIVVLTLPTSQAQLPAATTSAASAVTSTPTSAPTIAVETSTPTPAPIIATIVPPGDWVEFSTPGATLWLPPNFVGGDLVNQRSETVNTITQLGRYYRNAQDRLKNADKETVLWMVDKSLRKSDIMAIVSVSHKISTEETSIDDYIKNYMDSDSNGTPVAMLLTINQTKKMTLLGREAVRLTYSSIHANFEVIGLLYYIKDGADIWIVDYRLNANEYVDMLPNVVEKSIQTFNLVP